MEWQKRFFKKVKKTKTCWLWKGAPTKTRAGGYGRMMVDGVVHRTHRLSWLIKNGYIPKGLLILHRCDVRACVNPKHLFLGTPQDNMSDMLKKCRGNKAKGSHHGLSKLKEHDVIWIRKNATRFTQREIADRFQVSQTMISLILLRKNWSHI